MRTTAIQSLALGAFALTGCAMQDAPVVQTERDRAELARALADRSVAGPPMRCVDLRQVGGNRAIGRDAIVFTQGTRVYLNRPSGDCSALRYGNTLVTRTMGGELCRGDIARVVDPVTRTIRGSCSLGEFVPYERTR